MLKKNTDKKTKKIVHKSQKKVNIKIVKSFNIIPIIIATILLILDQISKTIIASWEVGTTIVAIPKVLWLTYVQNTGVSFGMFQGNNLIFIFISLIILGALIYWYDKFSKPIEQYAYWLILSGLFGNLLDRIFRGFVVDMLNLGWWPVFNIADSAISIAIILLIISELKIIKKK